MNRLILLLFLILTTHLSFGQACGVYRIKYVGLITSDKSIIKSIQLPTSQRLEGLPNDNISALYIDTKLENGRFEQKIRSLLATAYSDKHSLILHLKKKAPNLELKVQLRRNGIGEWKTIGIDWDKIAVSTIHDECGELFEFNLGEIKFDK